MKIILIHLVLPIFLFGNVSCSLIQPNPTDGIYLIPKGYTGEVVIVYDQPDGLMPELENGLYVFRIPENGIMKVKPPLVEGIVEHSYFYVDENNEKQKLEYLRITGDRDVSGKPKDKFDGQINQEQYENRVFIMNHEGGSFNVKDSRVAFTNFIVGKPKDSEKLYDNMQKRISQIQRDYLKN